MKLKKPPVYDKEPISTFLLFKDEYQIDYTYQREAGTWTKLDEQYLIDTILRGYAMPAIFIHTKDDIDFIVDGQQRLNTIWKFANNEIPLSEKYSHDLIYDEENKSGDIEPSKLFYKSLSKNWRNRFSSYSIPVIKLSGYNDEEIRDLFRRLQHGKPLIPGEILNAFPGEIVLAMRELASHRFFKDIISMETKRYQHYHLAAQYMFLESEGIKSITPQYIYEFFENNKNLNKNSKKVAHVKSVLNFLTSTFGEKTPELRRAWNITVYLLADYLIKNYAISEFKDDFKNFVINFYQETSHPDINNSEMMEFRDAIGKGTNEGTKIRVRHDFIVGNFLEMYDPKGLDKNRIFSEDQKRQIFRNDGEKCTVCGNNLNFGDENTHYHHKDQFIKGGRTETENGQLVCKDCHLTVLHGSNNQ